MTKEQQRVLEEIAAFMEKHNYTMAHVEAYWGKGAAK